MKTDLSAFIPVVIYLLPPRKPVIKSWMRLRVDGGYLNFDTLTDPFTNLVCIWILFCNLLTSHTQVLSFLRIFF